MDSRTDARRATSSAYANRIMANMGITAKLQPTYYCGDFDYLAVAAAASLPSLDNHDHKWHWQMLWQLFDEEWSEHMAARNKI